MLTTLRCFGRAGFRLALRGGAEMWLRGAQNAERRGGVDVDHRIPLRVAHVVDRAVPDIAGIVHDDVEIAERLKRRSDRLVAEIGRGDIADERHGAAALRRDRRHGLGGRIGVEVADHHLGAASRELARDRGADAAARPGHQRHPAVERGHPPLPVLGFRRPKPALASSPRPCAAIAALRSRSHADGRRCDPRDTRSKDWTASW